MQHTMALLGIERAMPKYFFHVTSNGVKVRDSSGWVFKSLDVACNRAMRDAPDRLLNAMRPDNVYVATQICDEEEQTLCVIRASIIIEHWKNGLKKKALPKQAKS
jgi:hypothetical protein